MEINTSVECIHRHAVLAADGDESFQQRHVDNLIYALCLTPRSERCVLSRTLASLPRLTTKSQPLSTTPAGALELEFI